MQRSKLWGELSDERGSASVEFLTIGMLLTVPLVYLVLALSGVQAAALATEGAARHAARLITVSDSHGAAMAAADAAVAVALADAGVADTDVRIECTPTPADCTTPGGVVTVTVSVAVPLPLMPPVFGLEAGLAVPMQATAAQPVSEFAR